MTNCIRTMLNNQINKQQISKSFIPVGKNHMHPTVGLRPAVEQSVGILTALTVFHLFLYMLSPFQQTSQTLTAATVWP